MDDLNNPKLTALGLLATGVAHDFNNLLSIIEGYGYILQQRIGNAPALQDKITAILNASHRGAEITGLLRDFGGEDILTGPSDLVTTIAENKQILRTLLGSRIELDFHISPITIMVDTSKNQIIQEMIFLGSRIGSTISGAGNLSITIDATHDEASLFMTNNATGHYVSHNFARANNLKDKTILVVDDEEALLPVLEHQLRNMGLKVLKAANADTALLLQKDYPDVIDFLLTDIVMPDVGGIELAEMIADHRPRMGVVYMTGYSKENAPKESVVLPKPLRPETLSQALQQALDKVTDA